MFAKLKSKMGDGVINQAVEKIEQAVKPHIDKILTLRPDDINNDDFYADQVINPAKLAIDVSTSGATQIIPKFEEKFKNAMFAIRDELIETTDTKITLVDDFENLYPQVLMNALKG